MASSEVPRRRNSNSQLLEELEALSQSLYQNHVSTTRRTASLVLPRTSTPVPPAEEADVAPREEKLRSRRMSMSPWRSRPKGDPETEQQKGRGKDTKEKDGSKFFDDNAASKEKKGIWNWKPMRALSHIGMQKLSSLFSVEVVAVQGLPASMNGLRLSVCVRKKETRDGAVHTMPSRVTQGAADFDETLFIKCHVYCSQSSGSQLPKFEPRPFIIYVFAVDAAELDFGRNSVDLSRLIQESLEKNAEGSRIRQWDISFDLAGKAKGGQLQVKLSFQIMEKDGGIGLFNQLEGSKAGKDKTSSSVIGRKQSKSSFSIPSPKLSSRMEVWTPSHAGTTPDIQGIEDLNLDEPAPAPSLPKPQKAKEEEPEADELDLPEFDVVDKGVEVQQTEETKEADFNNEKAEDGSESSEVVKEMVNDQFRLTILTELDSIAQQLKALESMMSDEASNQASEETDSQKLDADEETVTMEFLQMLEDEEAGELKQFRVSMLPHMQKDTEKAADCESKVYIPDLGKGLGCVIQTKNGGFLAATNPLNVVMSRKDTPKLAMQISRPFVLTLDRSLSGFELFQRMATAGLEELSSEVLTLMPMEELMGKTAEQVAFEGIASAIIGGRNKEGASSSAARSVAIIKQMANAMSTGRKERITTGIWNVTEDPLPADEILAFSMQKIEAMSVDALKIQADMAEEEAPFDVSPLSGTAFSGLQDQKHPLASAIPLEEWIKNSSTGVLSDNSVTIKLVMVIQLRDPLRRYEAVGGPMITLIHTTPAATKQEKNDKNTKFRVTSLHVGGMKAQKRQKRNSWDSEKQRLTAMQWLIAYNMGKAPKKGEAPASKGKDILWSISSRIVADMWLKSIRNPDVKFTK